MRKAFSRSREEFLQWPSNRVLDDCSAFIVPATTREKSMTGFRFMQQMLESSNTGRGEVPRGGLHKASLDRAIKH
jgi:hypothetical protein